MLWSVHRHIVVRGKDHWRPGIPSARVSADHSTTVQKADCGVGAWQGWSHGARAHPIIVATKVLLAQDDHWFCCPYPRLPEVSASQTSYRPGRTTGEFPYNPSHGISSYRLSHLGVVQRRVWKHSCGDRAFYQVLHIQPRTRLLEQQPKSSLTTSLFIMVSPHAYIATRGETSEAKLLKS